MVVVDAALIAKYAAEIVGTLDAKMPPSVDDAAKRAILETAAHAYAANVDRDVQLALLKITMNNMSKL